MTRLPLLAGLLALGCGGETARKPTADSRPSGEANPTGYRADPDTTALAGEWRVTAITASGKPVDAERVAGLKLTYRFAGTSLMVNRPGKPVQPWSYSLDSGATPKRIATKLLSDGSTANGIYDVDGNKLRLCLDVDGGPYPATFESALGSAVDLLTLDKAN